MSIRICIMQYAPLISLETLHEGIFLWRLARVFSEFGLSHREIQGLLASDKSVAVANQITTHLYIYENIWIHLECLFFPRRRGLKILSYTIIFLPQKGCADSA